MYEPNFEVDYFKEEPRNTISSCFYSLHVPANISYHSDLRFVSQTHIVCSY